MPWWKSNNNTAAAAPAAQQPAPYYAWLYDVLKLRVYKPQSRLSEEEKRGKKQPYVEIYALLDTGWSHTAVLHSVVKALGMEEKEEDKFTIPQLWAQSEYEGEYEMNKSCGVELEVEVAAGKQVEHRGKRKKLVVESMHHTGLAEGGKTMVFPMVLIDKGETFEALTQAKSQPAGSSPPPTAPVTTHYSLVEISMVIGWDTLSEMWDEIVSLPVTHPQYPGFVASSYGEAMGGWSIGGAGYLPHGAVADFLAKMQAA